MCFLIFFYTEVSLPFRSAYVIFFSFIYVCMFRNVVSNPENNRSLEWGSRSSRSMRAYSFVGNGVRPPVSLGVVSEGRITVNVSVFSTDRHRGQGQGDVRSRYDAIYYITQSTQIAALQHCTIALLLSWISSRQIGQSSCRLSSIFSSMDEILRCNEAIADSVCSNFD